MSGVGGWCTLRGVGGSYWWSVEELAEVLLCGPGRTSHGVESQVLLYGGQA
jgi:hypothetical protein